MTRSHDLVLIPNMTVHRTITAIASDPIRFGVFVAVDSERCSPDFERAGVGGIAKRPHQAGSSDGYEPGDAVTILADGGGRRTSPTGSVGSK